jgi:hypothetical protein
MRSAASLKDGASARDQLLLDSHLPLLSIQLLAAAWACQAGITSNNPPKRKARLDALVVRQDGQGISVIARLYDPRAQKRKLTGMLLRFSKVTNRHIANMTTIVQPRLLLPRNEGTGHVEQWVGARGFLPRHRFTSLA